MPSISLVLFDRQQLPLRQYKDGTNMIQRSTIRYNHNKNITSQHITTYHYSAQRQQCIGESSRSVRSVSYGFLSVICSECFTGVHFMPRSVMSCFCHQVIQIFTELTILHLLDHYFKLHAAQCCNISPCVVGFVFRWGDTWGDIMIFPKFKVAHFTDIVRFHSSSQG
ncbi:hypothetical protein Tcan_01759 [Toxocara canis]|uniref:Uncharacterized protein n=1 Tax=Toxocara canis TaxID=6265 RepID=A0A0B2VFH2_TOXCA|nr:hypothetical protein Tcan_01759 [Toxocara canis]